jgi:hypothetical protein
VAVLGCARGAYAQDISGRVVIYGRVEDASSRAPIEGVHILAVDSSAAVLSDSLGEFAIPLPAAGPYAVFAEQMGYLSQRFDLEAVSSSRRTVLILQPDPVELEALTVTAEAALGRLTRNIEGRARASAGAVTSLDRSRLERYGTSATVYDVLRSRAPRITECYDDPSELCTWSRSVTFRSAYPRVRVQVCVDERRSLSPVDELSTLSTEFVAKMEIFGRNTVYVYTIDWMLDRARSGNTTVYPEWMGCGRTIW